jgi:hypothetical protein
MDLDRGSLARIDRKLLAGICGDMVVGVAIGGTVVGVSVVVVGAGAVDVDAAATVELVEVISPLDELHPEPTAANTNDVTNTIRILTGTSRD